jgi:predicted unusual protein kinase regulating ubiquinone biosynthesis (AarF/ABC1/UbiB family)
MTHDGVLILLALVALIAVLALARSDKALAIWIATVWRFVRTVFVFGSAAVEGLVRRLRGERELGPALVRAAFEELGPTYLKLAQLIASSDGLFPVRYCQEFQKTLDRVRPFSFTDVERTITVELGAPPERLLGALDREPLASASIAQVHAATLHDGQQVVLKIQRPHIRRRVEADVRILRAAAWLMSFIPTVELANPVGIIDDFAKTIREELDFTLEAANMDEFNRMMVELGHADVRAPRVIHELTSARVITMERFHGVRVDDVAAIRARAVDSEAKLIYGLRAWFQSMILYGFFHGDVHAGNLMLLDDDSLGFLDFGIIGRFGDKTRRDITDYIVAFATGDYGALARVMKQMGAVTDGVDFSAMASDLQRAYAPLLAMSFGEINYGNVLPEILRVSVKHRVRLPREFVLVTKQMLYFDRYAKLLAPRLNIFSDPRLVAAISADVLRARSSNIAEVIDRN